MNLANIWESPGALLAVLTPLVAVPLTVITFYLRSLREQQGSRHSEIVHRLEQSESSIAGLRRSLTEIARDYTSKEEWLRECMHTRRLLERLTERTIRMEAPYRAERGQGNADAEDDSQRSRCGFPSTIVDGPTERTIEDGN